MAMKDKGLEAPLNPDTPHHPVLAVRGIAKELFKKLGGGEQFIRSERASFGGNREGETDNE